MKFRLLLILLMFFSSNLYSQNITEKKENEILKVPIFFHIVDKSLKSNSIVNIKDYENIIKNINERINNVNLDNIRPQFRDTVGFFNVEFFLPQKDKNNNPLKNPSVHSTILNSYTKHIDDSYLKSKGYYKPEEYLNIWFCNISGGGGHTPFKKNLDGIIIDIDELSYIVKMDDPFLIIHEIGHYFGLKHIWGNLFRGGCLDDDGIKDTPRQKKEHRHTSTPQVSCDGGISNHQNFMDYSYDTGMFTKEQVKVMRNYLKEKKPQMGFNSQANNYSDNQLNNTTNNIDEFKILYFLFYLSNEENVPNDIVKQYLIKLDEEKFRKLKVNSEQYNQRVNLAKRNIRNQVKNIKELDFNKKYKLSTSTLMSKYSQEKGGYFLFRNNYNIGRVENNKALSAVPYSNGERFDFYYSRQNKRYGKDPTKIKFINEAEFKFLKVSSQQSKLFNSKLEKKTFGYNVYYTFDFQILPKLVLGRNNTIHGIQAHIRNVTFYADKELKIPIKTIKSKSLKQ